MLFCKGKIPRLKLCKTCRVPFVPDADVGIDDLTAEGCGAWSCVQGLAAVKRHGQVCQACITFSELLRHYGVNVSDKGISKWEKGYNTPSIYQLVAICHALNIKEGPSYFMEKSVLHGFGQECGR